MWATLCVYENVGQITEDAGAKSPWPALRRNHCRRPGKGGNVAAYLLECGTGADNVIDYYWHVGFPWNVCVELPTTLVNGNNVDAMAHISEDIRRGAAQKVSGRHDRIYPWCSLANSVQYGAHRAHHWLIHVTKSQRFIRLVRRTMIRKIPLNNGLQPLFILLENSPDAAMDGHQRRGIQVF